MSRFSRSLTRINIIWRKELTDILRDRRTVIAMVLVPIVLYPAMMLGSLQAFELQNTRLSQETYTIGVAAESVQAWLRRVIDTDESRRTREQSGASRPTSDAEKPAARPATLGDRLEEAENARADVRVHPPPFNIVMVDNPEQAVRDGRVHIGLTVAGDLPTLDDRGSARVTLILDKTEVRSSMAATGLDAVLERAATQLLAQRLQRAKLELSFVRPLDVNQNSVATPEKVGGSILGQIVPLILIIMTISGAIYPAIDLTAGERERGTLETLMVAPVPTVDLIAGKFIVVTLIGMLSAFLNLLSIGGTIYMGGLGELLSRGNAVAFPLTALPWVLVVLLPLAVMFSALLLAVCSFARSFKEAQNYVMPVMVAALIPAVIGVLPGTRLEGPMLIMPVANIVVLTRELFMGRFDFEAILWVTLSTSIYAGAAVAVAAKLFGQEAVLFADSGSLKTIFQRRFFRPAGKPSASQALLLLALIYPLNFFVQKAIAPMALSAEQAKNISFLTGFALILIVLFVLLPMGAAAYMRVRIRSTFSLNPPAPAAIVAALCFGFSTWILVQGWLAFQRSWLPMDPAVERAFADSFAWLHRFNPLLVLFVMAVLPAFCEEMFFRGYALSGLRVTLGRVAGLLVVAGAFAMYHQSVHRLIVTAALGVLLGLLVLRWGSIWPAVIAHMMHNALVLSLGLIDSFGKTLAGYGFTPDPATGMPPLSWMVGATAILSVGLGLVFLSPRRSLEPTPTAAPEYSTTAIP